MTAVARGLWKSSIHNYCHKGQSIEVSTQDTKFCIQKNADGVLALEHSHAYYYQIQTQLFVCNADYCDFCVCTFSKDEEHEFHHERHRRRKVGAQGALAPPTLTGRGQSPPTFGFWTVYCTISYCMPVHFLYYMHLIISSVHDQFHKKKKKKVCL